MVLMVPLQYQKDFYYNGHENRFALYRVIDNKRGICYFSLVRPFPGIADNTYCTYAILAARQQQTHSISWI
jgi:hypothetical protein